MSVKLIAENILDADDFYSATEQEGERWGQPEPASDNAGSLRPVISGTPEDFTYSGTATSDGAAGGTTVIDSVLAAYGDDFFIGATVAITNFLQDTADYTESDGAGRVTLTNANTVTVADLDDDEEAWVVIDKTANHFDGDFEFHVDVKCTANGGLDSETCGVWALANDIDTLSDLANASKDYLAVFWFTFGGDNKLYLQECNAGDMTPTDSSIALTVGTQYYLKIKRDESVGTHGTLYCYIYSDSSHETLVDTLTITLTEKQDFRYLYWMVAKENGNAGRAWDGIISNLEIVSSESQSVTDFAQATGTLTTGAFTYQVNTGTAFTFTLPYSTRDFRFELIGSGDPGDATFKWSHNGGTTYFGRDDPNQNLWLAESVIVDADSPATSGQYCTVEEAENGDLVFVYKSNADDGMYYKISTDRGLTWGSATLIYANYTPGKLIKLNSGRLFLVTGSANYTFYSDDNGTTWTRIACNAGNLTDIIQAYDGSMCGVRASGGDIFFYKSTDEGSTWSTAVTVAADANTQARPTICQAHNGDLVCAYATDQDAVNDYEIKCKISTNMGSSWGSAIDIVDFGAGDKEYARLFKDWDGDLFCIYRTDSVDEIYCRRSTDNGATWGDTIGISGAGGGDHFSPGDVKVFSDRVMVVCHNETDQDYTSFVRGIWEAYSANACVCAPDGEAQSLVCGAEVSWYGGAGIAGDDWSFEAEYDYAMSNLIEDSPSRPWRSEQDNIECNIVIDMGATAKHYADGVAFFGCNVRTVSVQMNATNAWGAPSVDESVSFDFATGGVLDSDSGANEIHDAALLASYNDHELAGLYLRFTSGALNGETFQILDNVGAYIFCDGDTSTALTADTFIVYQGHIAHTFTGGPYRYVRISISAQNTAEGYYQLGTMVLGRAITLTDAFDIGYNQDHVYDVSLLRTPAGGLIPVEGAGRKRTFVLTWSLSDAGRREVLALLDHLQGKSLCLIPDSTDLKDVYLVKRVSDVEQEHFKDDYMTLEAEFEEVL